MAEVDAAESRAGTIYGVLGAFFPVAVAAVSLRLYSRVRFTYIGVDDVLIVLALVRFPRPLSAHFHAGSRMAPDAVIW